jgi:hypothetical protein
LDRSQNRKKKLLWTGLHQSGPVFSDLSIYRDWSWSWSFLKWTKDRTRPDFQTLFKPFIIERRTDDDLPQHIKGVAVCKEIKDEEGYWVFDILSTSYLAVEYEEATKQWYFI